MVGMIPKLHAITDPKHVIPLPPVANPHLIDLIGACLVGRCRLALSNPL
jgi:serine/threonine-protein kinase TTK/MPS1